MTEDTLHYMYVPLNKQALEIDMDQNGDLDTGNFKEWSLTETQACALTNTLFFDYSEKFDVFIDLSEDCVLKQEFVAEALNMARNFEQYCKKDFQKEAIKMVYLALSAFAHFFSWSTHCPSSNPASVPSKLL